MCCNLYYRLVIGLLHQRLLQILAVAIARTFTESFTGINYLNTPTYIIAELIGALIAKSVFNKKINLKVDKIFQ